MISKCTAHECPDRDESPPQAFASSSPDTSPELVQRQANLTDEDEENEINQGSEYVRKRGGYDSRIQQILYESPDLEIVIVDAGKSPDGSYIVYRIRTGVRIMGLLKGLI